MIELVLAHTDLARVRFAHSPIRELVLSLRALHDHSRQHMYGSSLSAIQGRLGGLPLPTVLRPLYQDPAAQLPVVVQELHRYWQAAVEPVWQRLQALCMADLSYRMEQFAGGGVARVRRELHPEISLEHD